MLLPDKSAKCWKQDAAFTISSRNGAIATVYRDADSFFADPVGEANARLIASAPDLLAQLALVTEQRDEAKIVLQLFLDAIDGDVRATQWFDSRIIERAKAAIAACGKPRTASTEKPKGGDVH